MFLENPQSTIVGECLLIYAIFSNDTSTIWEQIPPRRKSPIEVWVVKWAEKTMTNHKM